MRHLNCLACVSHDSIVYIEARQDDPGFQSVESKRFFLRLSRPPLDPIKPHVQWVWGFFPRGIMCLGHEVNYSPSFRAEVKNEWSYTPSSPICLHGVDRDSFIFHLYKLITET
jgi:hypothetical protein